MIKIIDIENIDLETKNKKIGWNYKQGRQYNNKNYKEFQELIAYEAMKTKKLIDPPYDIYIQQWSYHDIDACITLFLNALEIGKILDNDRNVYRLLIDKYPIKKGNLAKIRIFIQTLIRK